jgi:stage II sporulation protein E
MIKSQSFNAARAVKLQAALWAVMSFALFYIMLSSAKFGYACAVGLFAAALYYYNKNISLLVGFALAAAVRDFSLYMLFSVALPAAAIFLGRLALKKHSTPLRLCLIVVLSRLTLFFAGSDAQVTAILIEIFVSALFFLISVNALKAPVLRGIKNNVSVDETVCIAALALALYAGLYGMTIFGFKIYLTFASFTLLVSLFVFTLSFSLGYGLIIGAAVCLLSANPAHLGVFAMYALAANVFKNTSKYLAAVSVVLLDLLFAYYFNIYGAQYSYLDIAALAAGCCAFAAIPKKYMDKLRGILGASKEKHLSRHIINRTRAELNLKLVYVSEVFYEMEKIFSGMIKGYMSPEDAVNMLSADAKAEVCQTCPQKAKCHKENGDIIDKGFASTIRAGIDKGRVTLLDITPRLASVCIKTNSVLSVCGRLSSSYRQYAVVVSNLDTSRALIGRQFKGVGDILKQLAAETKNSVGFNVGTEKTIIDELAYNGIVCAEAVVYNENNADANISLLVKTPDSHDKRISRIISRLSGRRMVISKREESRCPDFSVLHLKPAPKYDVIFGAAGTAKEGKSISGDTHSLTRISDEKFLLVLCDGMGSGEEAEKTSSMAVGMVENFYRADFDSETILSAVNRLLNVGGEDNFAAIDICAINLKDGVCDFVKLGCPEGYIKTKTATDIIESNALPAGILEELTPSVTTKKVGSGDIIVLVSDGVADAFGERDNLKEFIFSENTSNPQQLAESILLKALDTVKTPKDDMTVLTMRVYAQV